MREIKFRIWKPLLEKMFAHEHIDYNQAFDNLDRGRFNDILMQYTGLKDENRKEIYEGDVISDGIKGLFLVEWNDDTCKFQFSDGTDINDGIRYGTSKLIMGNIYENPDLIAE